MNMSSHSQMMVKKKAQYQLHYLVLVLVTMYLIVLAHTLSLQENTFEMECSNYEHFFLLSRKNGISMSKINSNAFHIIGTIF